MAKIEPTVGRVVWYRACSEECVQLGDHDSSQPQAAIIAAVNADGTINLMVLLHTGTPYGRQNVPLIHDSDEPPAGSYAEWMPYQKGQAAKTEELEKKVNTPSGAPLAPAEPGAGLA